MTIWILAIDVGFKKTGLAVGQSLTKTAQPISVIRQPIQALTAEHFRKIINDWRISQIIIGLPEHQDNTEHPLHQPIKRLAEKLQVFDLPIVFVSEYLTSHEALQRLGKNKEWVDAMAAVIMAEDYLGEHL